MVAVMQKGCALGFASEQLMREREVVIDTVVEPFSRLTVALFCTGHARK